MADAGTRVIRPLVGERRYRFHGGLVLPGHREAAETPIRQAGVPPELVLPLQQHIGSAARIRVEVGEEVQAGQMIAEASGRISAPLHAPAAGSVSAIEPRPVPHPSGLSAECIVISTRQPQPDSSATPVPEPFDFRSQTGERLLAQVTAAGVVGLGGAGFPTGAKLGGGGRAELLLVNGAECEPYICCDEGLLRERADDVLEGIRVMLRIVQPQECVIAVEDTMTAAAQALQQALQRSNERFIRLVQVPTIYPTGGERQLIRVLTGREVPSQGLPADIGIICQNVGTAYATWRAVVRQQPLLSRIVTVTGDGIARPGNYEVLIGTPVRSLVEAAGGYRKGVDRLLIGGPMMGYALHTDNVPVIKTSNCILAVSRDTMPAPMPALPCIRCGQCTEVCPANLLPQQLYWHVRSGDHDAAQDFGLFDCIECGCCAHVCPSHIPLVQYYRHGKTTIWEQEKQKKASDLARDRHEARLARLERIKQERAAKLAGKKQALQDKKPDRDSKQEAIQAALERVRHRKEQADVTPRNTDNLSPEQQRLIDEVNARRARRENMNRDGEI